LNDATFNEEMKIHLYKLTEKKEDEDKEISDTVKLNLITTDEEVEIKVR